VSDHNHHYHHHHPSTIRPLGLFRFRTYFPLPSTVLIRPWPSLMDFSIHRHLVGLLGWGISPTQGVYRNTGQHNTETLRHTSMPRALFEHAISMLKLSYTVHDLDRSALETSRFRTYFLKIMNIFRHLVEHLGRGFAQCNGCTYTGQHKRKKKRITHPCREWDSKTRAQCSIGRRQYVL
jgi:hypothetical protein